MDNIPNPTGSQPELKELRDNCAYLQQLVSSLLLIIIVISGTLSVFLLRQWRFVRSELTAAEPAAMQLLTEYTNNRAGVEDFVKKLAEYGRGHPDFAPITDKYRLNDYLPKPGSAPVISSLPGAPSSKK
jgi:hypothetical protein